jgi:hypothetical protein
LVSVNDLGGNATTFPIIVQPVAGETIAGSSSIAITNAYGIVNLLADVQNGGWSFVSGSAGISGGLTDAPSDGTAYGRMNAAWVNVLLVAGHQTTTGGFRFTSFGIGTVASGTVTPDALNGNYQYLTNAGAFTLAAPGADCAIDILVTNGAGAGVVGFSGFMVSSNVGDALDTISGHNFIISVRRINGVATYLIKALQ